MTHRDLVRRALLPLLIVGLVAACGGGDDAPSPEGQEAAETEMPFDVSTAGNVQGSVTFTGSAPPPEPIDMSSEPTCAEKWDEEPNRQPVQVSDGQLAEVFVYVKEGLEDMSFPAPQEEVLIDQDGCRYIPGVVGVMTNQPLTFRNSDGLLHNISTSPQANRPFNISQPVDMDTERTFAQPEVMIPVECDVHGWMQAYIGVVEHPYHAVTGEGGSFDLSDLPPGEYVVEAWHSRLGTQEQTVTVATGETAEVAFEFDEGMIDTAVVPLGDPIDPHDHNPFQRRSAQGETDAHVHAAGESDLR